MTDRSKFEQMLEYLISEEQEKAKEIFHQLVVEKSREIYETILAEDFNEAKEEDEDDEEVEEGMEVTFRETEDEEDEMEAAGDDEMDMMGGDDDGEIGGDATDDFMGDIEGGDDMDGAEDEGDLEDRVVDLEDALDDLRAEFEQMMGDEGSEEAGEEEGEEEAGEEEGEEDEEEIKDSFDVSDNFMREYIEKVTMPKGGDDGVNTKSIVAGKNDMGGTTANIAKGGEAKGEGTKGGLLNPGAKEENFGNINVPGGNAGKTAFKKREPGHGAERKGSGDNGDKSAGSPINGAPNRAK